MSPRARRTGRNVGATAFQKTGLATDRAVMKVQSWSFGRPAESRHVAGYVLLLFRVHLDEATGLWEGRCDELDIASCGDDYHQALEATIEATEDYLNVIESLGQREVVFEERGLVVDRAEPVEALHTELPPGEILSAQRGVLVDC